MEKKLRSPKAIRLKPTKTAFPLVASNAKTIDGTQKTPTQTRLTISKAI
jgi:hypothetical protein